MLRPTDSLHERLAVLKRRSTQTSQGRRGVRTARQNRAKSGAGLDRSFPWRLYRDSDGHRTLSFTLDVGFGAFSTTSRAHSPGRCRRGVLPLPNGLCCAMFRNGRGLPPGELAEGLDLTRGAVSKATREATCKAGSAPTLSRTRSATASSPPQQQSSTPENKNQAVAQVPLPNHFRRRLGL